MKQQNRTFWFWAFASIQISTLWVLLSVSNSTPMTNLVSRTITLFVLSLLGVEYMIFSNKIITKEHK